MAPEVSLTKGAFFTPSIVGAEVNFCPIFQGSGHRGKRGLPSSKGAAAFLQVQLVVGLGGGGEEQ